MATLGEVLLVAGIAGCATGVGAIPVFFTERISHRLYDGAVGFAGGVMFGAAVFTLVVPGLDFGTIWEVGGGILAGGIFLLGANSIVPHLHVNFAEERQEGTPLAENDDLRRALLVGTAITIHNVPEGLAMGIAFAGGEDALALTLALAIGIQNIPDGFAIAVPSMRAGVSKWKTLMYTTLSGGVPEPIAAAVGFSLVLVVTGLFPIAAGFAAGAMMAVVSREMIPASHGHDYEDFATLTFVAGFVVMMFLDVGIAV